MEEDLNIEAVDRNAGSFSDEDGEESSSYDEDTESEGPGQGVALDEEDLGRLESTQQNMLGGGLPLSYPSMVDHDRPRNSLYDKKEPRGFGQSQLILNRANEDAVTHNLGSHRPSVNERFGFPNADSQNDLGRTGTFLFAGMNQNIMQSAISDCLG